MGVEAGDGSAGLLPPGFLVGVATSGYQVEGGFNGPGQPANNWAGWEQSGRVARSGIACDFWREPEQALDRAASLGCNAFRLSVEWARIEPADGEVDETALDRYAALLAACAERGLQPVVTLHHFTHPAWLGDEFWLMPGSPDRFAGHVATVAARLAPWCRRWITVNEPNILALAGWITGDHPPGRRLAPSDAVAVVDNLLTAHVLAHRVVRGVQPEAVVTLNTSASSIYEHDRLLTDLLCARSLGIARHEVDPWVAERRALHDAMFPPSGPLEWSLRRLFAQLSPYGSSSAPRPRRRAPFPLVSPRRVLAELYGGPHPRPLDTVAFDWYDPVASHALRLPGLRTAGGRSWAPAPGLWDVPPDPGGLARWCGDEHRLVGDVPLWVAENGMATRVRNGRPAPRLDGWDRPRYLRAHLGAVVDAAAAGAPVGGYLHWSLMDNYEWGSYEPRFGLYGLERHGGAVRWLETDAAGYDSPAAYRRLVTGLRAGDPGALERR